VSRFKLSWMLEKYIHKDMKMNALKLIVKFRFKKKLTNIQSQRKLFRI